MQDEINIVDPCKPELEELFIKGIAIGHSTKKAALSEKIDISEQFGKEELINIDTEPSVLKLSINDLIIKPQMETDTNRKVFVIFDYDVNSKKVATEHIILKNLGTTTIRFFWKETEVIELFKDILPEKVKTTSFNFNKNAGLIIPGEEILFPIWFKTETTGTYCENWEFVTKPQVMPENVKLLVVLHASAVISDLDERMCEIKERLNNSMRHRLINEALSAALSNVPYPKFKPTVYSYNKKDIFEAVNGNYNPLQRKPKYVYNKEVVRELQQIYKKVKRKVDPKCWNYRIDELRLLAAAKQKRDDILRMQRNETFDNGPQLPKLKGDKTIFPKFESETDKHKFLKRKLNTESRSVSKEETPLTDQLEKVIAKLKNPDIEGNSEQHKYAQVYLIMCTYFNRICNAIEDLKSTLGIYQSTTYPKHPKTHILHLNYKPIRLTFETFYDVYEKPQLKESIGTLHDKPPSELIKDIPIEECKKRYKTYYDLPDTPPPESAKGGAKKSADKKDKASGKEKKDDKKEKKPQTENSDEEDGYVVNELFDPYAYTVYPPIEDPFEESPSESLASILSNEVDVSPAIYRQYKYNLYVIIYNYLEQLIGDVVNMLEMQPPQGIPYACINEIETSQYNKRLIDLKALLVQESLDKLKAKIILYNYRKKCVKDWKKEELKRQLRSESDSSLWSILRSYESKPRVVEGKPVSYPIDHYEKLPSHTLFETQKETDEAIELPFTVHKATSTLDSKIDPNWEDFKEVSVQKDYSSEDTSDDLVAYVERVISELSVQELYEKKVDKETQKDIDDYVSDEEHFYYSDSGESHFSLNSEQNEEDICSLSNLSICTCEGYGECNESSNASTVFNSNENLVVQVTKHAQSPHESQYSCIPLRHSKGQHEIPSIVPAGD